MQDLLGLNLTKTPFDYQKAIPLDLEKIKIPYLEIDPKKNFSGIYACFCKGNNKYYLGSTGDFYDRRSAHNSLLRDGEHHAPYFQNSFNKYGVDNFVWIKIEEVIEAENLKKVEDIYLAKYRPFDPSIGFNVAISATFGTVKTYEFITFEGQTIKGMHLSKFCWENKYDGRCLNQLIKGEREFYKNLINPKDKDRLKEIVNRAKEAEYDKSHYKVYSKDGKLYEGVDRTEFRKKFGLESYHFTEFLNGNRGISYAGWILFDPLKHPNRDLSSEELQNFEKEKEKERVSTRSKTWEFYLNDKKISIKNLWGYARENGVCAATLEMVSTGERLSPYKNYTSADEGIRASQLKFVRYGKIICIKQSGEIEEYSCRKDFLSKTGLNYSGIYAASSKNAFYKGYFIISGTLKLSDSELSTLIEEKKRILFASKK